MYLLSMSQVQALRGGDAPGEGCEPVQVVSCDIELTAAGFQAAQLRQLLLYHLLRSLGKLPLLGRQPLPEPAAARSRLIKPPAGVDFKFAWA